MARWLPRALAGEDVAARSVSEIGRPRCRPLGDLGRPIDPRPRGQAAGNAQCLQEALRDWIGLAAGQPPRTGRRVQTLDRHHIGYTEAREGVTYITFTDETAQVGKLRR